MLVHTAQWIQVAFRTTGAVPIAWPAQGAQGAHVHKAPPLEDEPVLHSEKHFPELTTSCHCTLSCA